ncbi:UDP-N-acetylglucosamine--N-acetylmuramyl-(pentapeptide) pyrophosphoryl-undecaprenol N-acetylglucosamine transferase, partial [Mycobacterium ulcerans]
LTPALVAREVPGLLTDPPRLAAMTAAAASRCPTCAAAQVAQAALDIARLAPSRRRAVGGRR